MRSTEIGIQRFASALGVLLALAFMSPAVAGPPEVSGIVMRGTTTLGATWPDFKEGTRIVVGLDIRELCEGTVDVDIISFQDAALQDRINSIGWGEDVQTTVWPFLDFDCDFFLNVDPIASGAADWVLPDNDVFETGDQAHAYGFNVRGFLTTPDGVPARVNAHVYFTIVRGVARSINSRIVLSYKMM